MAKTKRKSTGKRLRFTVFERDSFTCQYCGRKPPEVVLHADHLVPVSKGGENEVENLITSCADCNLGKATRQLGTAPEQAHKNVLELQEKYDQLKAFYSLQKKMASLKDEAVSEIEQYWSDMWEGRNTLTNYGRTQVKNLLKWNSIEQLQEAIDITASKNIASNDRFRYMCGVLHNKKKARELEEMF